MTQRLDLRLNDLMEISHSYGTAYSLGKFLIHPVRLQNVDLFNQMTDSPLNPENISSNIRSFVCKFESQIRYVHTQRNCLPQTFLEKKSRRQRRSYKPVRPRLPKLPNRSRSMTWACTYRSEADLVSFSLEPWAPISLVTCLN